MSREEFDKNMQELIGTDATTNFVKDAGMTIGRFLAGYGAGKIAKNFCSTFGYAGKITPLTRASVCVASFALGGELFDYSQKAFDRQIEELAKILVDVKAAIKGD